MARVLHQKGLEKAPFFSNQQSSVALARPGSMAPWLDDIIGDWQDDKGNQYQAGQRVPLERWVFLGQVLVSVEFPGITYRLNADQDMGSPCARNEAV